MSRHRWYQIGFIAWTKSSDALAGQHECRRARRASVAVILENDLPGKGNSF